MLHESNESPVFVLLTVRDLIANTNVYQINESWKRCGKFSLVFLYNYKYVRIFQVHRKWENGFISSENPLEYSISLNDIQ
jgi:hypothetical protein